MFGGRGCDATTCVCPATRYWETPGKCSVCPQGKSSYAENSNQCSCPAGSFQPGGNANALFAHNAHNAAGAADTLGSLGPSLTRVNAAVGGSLGARFPGLLAPQPLPGGGPWWSGMASHRGGG